MPNNLNDPIDVRRGELITIIAAVEVMCSATGDIGRAMTKLLTNGSASDALKTLERSTDLITQQLKSQNAIFHQIVERNEQHNKQDQNESDH